jgi:Cu(I)/Ag(I) efflux system membrane protein CusA/SilA
MLVHPDHALDERRTIVAREGRSMTSTRPSSKEPLNAYGRMMTAIAIMAGLLPIMWRHLTRSEVIRRVAVPMVSGMILSAIHSLVVIPTIYAVVEARTDSSRTGDIAALSPKGA